MKCLFLICIPIILSSCANYFEKKDVITLQFVGRAQNLDAKQLYIKHGKRPLITIGKLVFVLPSQCVPRRLYGGDEQSRLYAGQQKPYQCYLSGSETIISPVPNHAFYINSRAKEEIKSGIISY